MGNPIDTSSLQHRLLAILAADAVGYSRLMSLDEYATLVALEAGRAVFRRQVAGQGGRIVDTAGDSVLAVFPTARGAMAASVAVQRELAAANASIEDDSRLLFRIGVHVGDVIERADGTVYGDGVNIAARLQSLAERGGIAASEAMRAAVKGKSETRFDDQGEKRVKHFAEPLRVFAVRAAGIAIAPRADATVASLRFGRFELLLPDRRLLVDGEAAALNTRAMAVLAVLAESAGQLVTKRQLQDGVRPSVALEEHDLAAQIGALRQLLGGEVIATVPGRGYRFIARLERGPADAIADATDATPGHFAGSVAPALKTNLPETPPALIGRDEDLARLAELVDRQRLVTIVGAGGMGKTSLAQALLCARRDAYTHGVCWVELAAARHAAALPGVIAAALGVSPGSGDPLAGLVAAVTPLTLLMALDNAEHLLLEVGRVAAALRDAAPGLRLLVTSQAPLKVAAEHLYRLGPLGTPPGPLPPAESMDFGAVALFVARARAMDARFALTDSNVALVVGTCRALDGLALAVELAAARAPVLGMQRLASSLNQRLQVLTANRNRAAPERQQTLRAALEWSYGLLDEPERVVFRRLAVLAGSSDLELIQQVVADDTIDKWSALDILGSLVDRSLVAVIDGEPPRYRMLESARALAAECLVAVGEDVALRERHAAAMAHRWEASWGDRYRGDLSIDAWEQALDADVDNARAAFAWARLHDRCAALAIGALLLTRLRSEPRSEAVRVAEEVESCIDPDAPPLLRARVWHELSLLWGRSSPRHGRRCAQRAVDLFRGQRDAMGLYMALDELAFVSVQSDLPAAEAALQEAKRIEQPDWPPSLLLLGALPEGIIASDRGDHERALAVGRRMVALQRAAGDSTLVAEMNCVDIEMSAGRADNAVREGQALVERLRGTRHQGTLAWARLNLCAAAVMQGDLALARRVAAEGWASAMRYGMQAWWADHLSLLAALEGRARTAAKLAGHADLVYRRTDDERQGNEARAVARARELARNALGGDEVERLQDEGASLSDEDIAALALAFQDR